MANSPNETQDALDSTHRFKMEYEKPTELGGLEPSSRSSNEKEHREGGGNGAEELTNSVPTKFNLHGWRFNLTLLALCIACFLSTMESTIVSTSLVSITDALGGLQKSSWIVTAYLVTYTAVFIIAAKLSDAFGRKLVFVVATTLFTVFSIACGTAQTFNQLIIFRAFQGIGGGAMHSLVWVILAEMAPPETYAKYNAMLSSVFALSLLLGPLFGGLINDKSTWRWVYLMNGPGGGVILALVLISMPWSFPLPYTHKVHIHDVLSGGQVRKVDWLGALVLLAADVLLIASLEEGGTDYSWTNAVPLVLLFVSIALWLILGTWSKIQSNRQMKQASILPWRILTNRFTMGALLIAFINGAVLITSIIILPQRFQVVNGLSPLDAAYRLLALTLCGPFAGVLAGAMMQKFKTPPFHVMMVASSLQILGVGLLTTIGSSVADGIPSEFYGFQVIMGFGFGMTTSVVLMIVPLVFEDRDIVGMGAVNQFRYLGGGVWVAIATNVLNSRLKGLLASKLASEDLDSLIKSAAAIRSIPADSQLVVRDAFGEGYKLDFWVVFALSVAGLFANIMLWEKRLRRFD